MRLPLFQLASCYFPVLYRARPLLPAQLPGGGKSPFLGITYITPGPLDPPFSGIKNITSAPPGLPFFRYQNHRLSALRPALFGDIQNLHSLFCPIVYTRHVASCDMILHSKHLANKAGDRRASRLFTFVDNPGAGARRMGVGARAPSRPCRCARQSALVACNSQQRPRCTYQRTPDAVVADPGGVALLRWKRMTTRKKAGC